MKQKKLVELFRLTLAHQYYKKNIDGLFTVEPTEDGLKTLQSYDLHFKQKEAGFVVAGGWDTKIGEDYVLANPFESGTKLSFAVFTNNEHFYDKFKELTEPTPGKYVYYFNNLDGTKRRTSLLKDVKGIRDTERVELHTKIFSGKVLQNLSKQYILPIVYDHLDNVVLDTRYDVTIDEFKGTYQLDMSRMDDGVYTIEYDTDKTTYYCTKASMIRRCPLIILEFFVDDTIPDDYQIIKRINGAQYCDPKKFTLHFRDSLFFWRYTIIPDNLHYSIWIKTLTNLTEHSFTPGIIKISNHIGPVQFTSLDVITSPAPTLEVNLYRADWHNSCTVPPPFYYCGGNYGIEEGGIFWCRKKIWVNGQKQYEYQCGCRYDDHLIGRLPHPGEIDTVYYNDEDGNEYAEMTLYLTKSGTVYYLTTEKPVYCYDD